MQTVHDNRIRFDYNTSHNIFDQDFTTKVIWSLLLTCPEGLQYELKVYSLIHVFLQRYMYKISKVCAKKVKVFTLYNIT